MVKKRYCQRKPDVALSTREPDNLIPDKSMDEVEANCVFRDGFS